MSPIQLADSELDAIYAAAAPIAAEHRPMFLQQVAAILADCPEPGPGTVYRAIRVAQQAHLDPPDLSGTQDPRPRLVASR